MRATGLLSRRTLVLCVSVAVLPLMGALSTANAGGKAVAAGVGGTGKVIPLGVGGTGKDVYKRQTQWHRDRVEFCRIRDVITTGTVDKGKSLRPPSGGRFFMGRACLGKRRRELPR